MTEYRFLPSCTRVVLGIVLLVVCRHALSLDSALAAPQHYAFRFSFTADRITLLADLPKEEVVPPTRANIVRAFQRLAEVAGPADQVVIFLAGHGSQQPANDAPDNFEPDGLDEIFLPADVAGWNKTVGQVENAIIDDEIHAWVMAIRAKGAFVWVIVDACHAGTMTRGAPSDQMRERLPASRCPRA